VAIHSITSGAPLHFGFSRDGIGAPDTAALPLIERVAAKILARQAAHAPNRPFVQFGNESVTYGEASRRANRTANALAGFGIGKGSRVAILMRNRLEYFDLWFGLSRLGAVQVPLNTEYKMLQIAHVFNRAPIDAVVAESDLLPELLAALRQIDASPRIFALGPVPGAQLQLGAPERAEAIDYARVIPDADDRMPESAEAVTGADVGAVMNTSGTTGPSKGVMLSHAQQYLLGRMIAADMDLNADDVYYNFFPLFHNTAQAMITIPVLLVGARMVLTERFSASRFWPDVREHQCTAFYYIGEIAHILLKSTAVEDAHGSRLRVGWGIGASPQNFVEFGKRFGVAMRTGYGSTEANVPCYLPHDSDKPQSCGQSVRGFEVKIANELGEAVPAGETGEILIRSSEPWALMLGYDGDPVATVAAWQDLWLHSGDLGCLDDAGYLYFKGRVKDSIRVRGENISAFEVEQVIGEVDGVVEVAAIAVPSELGGDELKIVVVVGENAPLTPASLVAHAERHLPRYSIPRYIEFVSVLPKTPTNKVQKHLLRSTPFAVGTWDRHAPNRAADNGTGITG
jgi:carnitine-CoA ligase